MGETDNRRETGARSYPAKVDADASDEVSQEAAENRRPPGGMGNSSRLDDLDEKTRHSDGQKPATRTAQPKPASVSRR